MLCLNQWGAPLGLEVLKSLCQLYTSLLWESTVLLAFCSDTVLPPKSTFGVTDLNKLHAAAARAIKIEDDGEQPVAQNFIPSAVDDLGSNGMSAAMQSLSTTDSSNSSPSPMDTDDSGVLKEDKIAKNKLAIRVKLIKPLLNASSRLGRALAELFGLLVKLTVGSPMRQRRPFEIPRALPFTTPSAHAVAKTLASLLTDSLTWEPPSEAPINKLR